MEPKYPGVEVELVGHDGNSFAILGTVRRAMKRAGLTPEQITEYVEEATSGDADHLLQTTMRYVEVV